MPGSLSLEKERQRYCWFQRAKTKNGPFRPFLALFSSVVLLGPGFPRADAVFSHSHGKTLGISESRNRDHFCRAGAIFAEET